MVPSVARSGRLLRFRCRDMISCAAVGLLGEQLTAIAGPMWSFRRMQVYQGLSAALHGGTTTWQPQGQVQREAASGTLVKHCCQSDDRRFWRTCMHGSCHRWCIMPLLCAMLRASRHNTSGRKGHPLGGPC